MVQHGSVSAVHAEISRGVGRLLLQQGAADARVKLLVAAEPNREGAGVGWLEPRTFVPLVLWPRLAPEIKCNSVPVQSLVLRVAVGRSPDGGLVERDWRSKSGSCEHGPPHGADCSGKYDDPRSPVLFGLGSDAIEERKRREEKTGVVRDG